MTQAGIERAMRFLLKPEVQDFIAAANREYHHWDKLRYRPRPVGMSAEDAWCVLRMSRITRRIHLPLLDESGVPFTYWLPEPTAGIFHEVDRGGGTFVGASADAAEGLGAMRDRMVLSSLMEEAIATSQIEGAVTTRQVAKEMLRTKRKPKDRSETMILNSYLTFQMLRERVREPLTLDLLLEIQTSMTRGTLDDPTAAGRFRTADEQISVMDSRDGEVMHVPPAADKLEERMEKMFAFTNAAEDKSEFMHPLVRAAILHFWLAYEHPFVDGNGRTARALLYWYMLKNGYWLFEYLTISRAIMQAPAAYYESFLYSESDDNDLTYSVMYQLRTTRRALNQLHEYLALKQREQGEMAAALRRFPDLNHRQRAVLQEAYRDPSREFTFASHQDDRQVTLVTARSDLIELANIGLLRTVKRGRQRAFLAAEDLPERLALGRRPRRRGKP